MFHSTPDDKDGRRGKQVLCSRIRRNKIPEKQTEKTIWRLLFASGTDKVRVSLDYFISAIEHKRDHASMGMGIVDCEMRSGEVIFGR